MRTLVTGGVLLCCLALSSHAFSQSSFATLTGTIQDASGALIPGVTIKAANNATGVVTTALSNEAGAYNLPGLLPGIYKVTAELPGFQTQTFTDVQTRKCGTGSSQLQNDCGICSSSR